MALQQIIKLTRSQYQTLANGGSVGGYSGFNPNYLYLVEDTAALPTTSGLYGLLTNDNGTTFSYTPLGTIVTHSASDYLPITTNLPTPLTTTAKSSVTRWPGVAYSTDVSHFVTPNDIYYWNGAVTGTTSYLAYCNQGAFGTIVTHGEGDYLPISGGVVTGATTIQGTTVLANTTGYYSKVFDQAQRNDNGWIYIGRLAPGSGYATADFTISGWWNWQAPSTVRFTVTTRHNLIHVVGYPDNIVARYSKVAIKLVETNQWDVYLWAAASSQGDDGSDYIMLRTNGSWTWSNDGKTYATVTDPEIEFAFRDMGAGATAGNLALTSDLPAFYGTTFRSGDSSNEGHDCNAITDNGHYYYHTNGPSGLGESTTDGGLYVQSFSGDWVGQIAQDYRNGSLFVRGKNYGSWTNWKRIIDSGNIGSQSVSYATSAGTATAAGSADLTTSFASTWDNARVGTGMRPFYNWGNAGGINGANYCVGFAVGSNPLDANYGFQIGQNLWDDRLYIRRLDYNSWQTQYCFAYLGDNISNFSNDSGYIVNGDDYNFVNHGNEFTFVPDGFSGSLWFNYRSRTGYNSNISLYVFGNGGQGYASIEAYDVYARNRVNVGSAHMQYNSSEDCLEFIFG